MGNSASVNDDERVINENNLRDIQGGLSYQPTKEAPLDPREMARREQEGRQEYQRKKEHRAARINKLSRQWSANQMANSAVDNFSPKKNKSSPISSSGGSLSCWCCA
jgi:hypothetical protein